MLSRGGRNFTEKRENRCRINCLISVFVTLFKLYDERSSSDVHIHVLCAEKVIKSEQFAIYAKYVFKQGSC